MSDALPTPSSAPPSPGAQLAGVAVVALSGGLDSTSLLLHLLARRCQVFGVSFDYGQRHRVELERLAANARLLCAHNIPFDWQTVDLSGLGQLLDSALTDANRDVPQGHYTDPSMRATVVPNRNAIFAAVLYGYALSLTDRLGADVSLSMGVHSGDHAIYPDCRPEFYQLLWPAFQAGNWGSERVRLYLPYLHADKHAILCDAQTSCRQLGLEFTEVFRNTSTSYLPDESGRPHGLTGSDVERILAFDRLGVADPLEYPWPWPEAVRRARAAQQAQ